MARNKEVKNEDEYEVEAAEEEEEKNRPFACFEAPAGKQSHFYLSEPIGPPKNYVEMIQRIKGASPFDIIYIYLNTPGGDLMTGIQLISAMKMSPAHIVTSIEGEVCSLGTIIFLSGDEMMVHDHCLFMVHNHTASHLYGKGHEYLASANATVKWFEEIARDVYTGFLTEDEINRMLSGQDFWMTSDEVRERLKTYVEHLDKKAQMLEAARQAEMESSAPKAKRKRVVRKKTK